MLTVSFSHTCFFFSFFTHLLNFVRQRKEDITQTHNIHNSHAHSKQCRRTQSNVIVIWDFEFDLDPKCGSRCTNTQKKEASIIKALVGPGERRSLFQTPELPHWYHSVQFCSCNSIVCPRDQSGLAMLIIMWTYSREDDQYCHVLKRINTAKYCFHLIMFSLSCCTL